MRTSKARARAQNRLSVSQALERIRRVAKERQKARPAFRRHSPEVGAVCGKAARTDLCGGARKLASLPRPPRLHHACRRRVRRRGDRISTDFAALRSVAIGTWRRFAAVPNFGSNRGEADMQRASRTCRSNENDPSAGMRPCLCRCEERIRPPHPGKTRPVVRRPLGRYASAFLMRSGVNGVWRKRAPVSWAIALPIAGVTNGVAICPTPVGGLSVDITSMCIGGTSLMRGIR
jgi:hypothetical protein